MKVVLIQAPDTQTDEYLNSTYTLEMKEYDTDNGVYIADISARTLATICADRHFDVLIGETDTGDYRGVRKGTIIVNLKYHVEPIHLEPIEPKMQEESRSWIKFIKDRLRKR